MTDSLGVGQFGAVERDPREFKTLDAFVNEFLGDVYRRQVTDQHTAVWCPQWWRHPEAVLRLSALWNTYEYLQREETTGLSVWWLEHADCHMPKLLDPQGPFKYCSERGGHKSMLAALPTSGSSPRPDLMEIAGKDEYATLDEFVNEWLSVAYARQIRDVNDTVWCPDWREHKEAVLRLTAMWRAFNHLRGDVKLGVSSWWTEHADRHMVKLFDPTGPFKYCSVRNGHKNLLAPLPGMHGDASIFVEPTDEELRRHVKSPRRGVE